MPSQVIVGRTISKKQMLMSVCTKIGIQLNCKLGGEAWAVEIPVSTVMTSVFILYLKGLCHKDVAAFDHFCAEVIT